MRETKNARRAAVGGEDGGGGGKKRISALRPSGGNYPFRRVGTVQKRKIISKINISY